MTDRRKKLEWIGKERRKSFFDRRTHNELRDAYDRASQLIKELEALAREAGENTRRLDKIIEEEFTK